MVRITEHLVTGTPADRKSRNVLLRSLLIAFAAGCASAGQTQHTDNPGKFRSPLVDPSLRSDSRFLRPTKEGSACDSLREVASRTPELDYRDRSTPPRITPPQPVSLIKPPLPAPSTMRGSLLTIHMRISERGQVMADSLEMVPDRSRLDPAYLRKVRQEFLQSRFWPAIMSGCAVSARYWMELRFGGTF